MNISRFDLWAQQKDFSIFMMCLILIMSLPVLKNFLFYDKLIIEFWIYHVNNTRERRKRNIQMIDSINNEEQPIQNNKQNSQRDEISESDYRRLLLISLGTCANPNCNCALIREDGSYIGQAAHICAARPGGPRYDENQTPEQRKSIDNFILLCNNCHRMIDDKAAWTKYSVEKLKDWKKQHETRCLEIRSKEFAQLSVRNLDIAAMEIIRHLDKTCIANNTFKLMNIQSKMDKHFFSPSSRFLVKNTVGISFAIKEYLDERTSEDDEFTNQIRFGILSVYYKAMSDGYKNDDLFTKTLADLRLGIKDIAQETAIIALCVYYMEHCDLFSEE
ncbi:MAG: hypothetical protein IJH67_08115 [Thermoguttaceae bacterium]|nr:hypothetical protein [Thermoguttaceae bacterium]